MVKKNETTGKDVKETTSELPLLEQIMTNTRLQATDEGYDVAKRGVEEFLKELLQPQHAQERVEKKQVDAMISELDKRLGFQMDEILHHPDFQSLESAWTNLEMLVDRTDFRENIKINVFNVSKEDLSEDLGGVSEITKSGFYSHIYTAEYGQYGGDPVGAIIGNYEFSQGSQDIELLKNIASVSAMSHAPFIAAASPKFLGIESFQELPGLKEIDAIFEGPRYQKWQSFRESDDARNVGLTIPGFMLRPIYGEDHPAKTFTYQESTDGSNENYLWGNAAFAFATNLTDSFAKYRWCPNIIGPKSGGGVDDLPLDSYEKDGEIIVVGPTEVALSDRREFELAEQGFMALTMRKATNTATFFSANSTQKPKFFGNDEEAKQAELNYRLGTQLPYLFVISRLAHYIKVLQRENLGSWKSKNDLDRELNQWIRQYVANQDNPPPGVVSRRPLRSAEIAVAEVEGEAGWYQVDIKVTPHFKYMGANFTLFLTGRLEKD